MENNIFVKLANECFSKKLYSNWRQAREGDKYSVYKCPICEGIHRSSSNFYKRKKK
jgi:hypothetical protein